MEIVFGLLVLGFVATTIWLVLATVVTVRGLRRPPRHAMARALASGAPLSPEDTTWTTETWSFHAADGTELPVWTVQGDGVGPVTVLIHEWGHSRVDWLPFVEAWRAQSPSVVIPDLRGHGDAKGFCTFGRNEIDDLVGLIQSLGTSAIRIVGCGFGGTLALGVTATIPEAVSEVFAIKPWTPEPQALFDRLCDTGFQIRPPKLVFDYGIKFVGMDSLLTGSIPAGPTIHLQSDPGATTNGLLDRIGRDDVCFIDADTSSM
ncbi:MAG: alpha/beta hydrolase [Planctomycetota bacterium]|nr:alpha/beta hydrolase [Planctomycetota bacterium]